MEISFLTCLNFEIISLFALVIKNGHYSVNLRLVKYIRTKYLISYEVLKNDKLPKQGYNVLHTNNEMSV